jgi:hypothetical protein
MVVQVESSRRDNDNACKCLLDCILGCLEDLAQYFNRYAFTYVGPSTCGSALPRFLVCGTRSSGVPHQQRGQSGA